MLDAENPNKKALSKFINRESGLVLEVPKIPDIGNWPQEHLSGAQKLIAQYEEVLRKVEANARGELERNGQNKHIFQSELGSNKKYDQIVIQIERAKKDEQKHAFIEFLSEIPTKAVEPSVLIEPPKTFTQRFYKWLGREEVQESAYIPAAVEIFSDEIDKPKYKNLIARVITMPMSGENIAIKNTQLHGLFNRSLAAWWHLLIEANTSSEEWARKIPKEMIDFTSWSFHFDQSGTINRLHYFHKNAPEVSYMNEFSQEIPPGIKLLPPSTAGYRDHNHQLLSFNLETGDVRNEVKGISVNGIPLSVYEYALHDGMLDLKGSRFASRDIQFSELLTDVLSDMPIKVETLAPENQVQDSIDL